MPAPRELRVLVAVQPVVLEGALASILELIGLDLVVQFHTAQQADRDGFYDAAIVSAGFPDEVQAWVTITLPDTQAPAGAAGTPHPGHISTRAASHEVDIRDQREIISLLDEHVPAVASRKDRLADALTRRAS